MKENNFSAVKWICGTIIFCFLIYLGTMVLIPLGIMTIIPATIHNILGQEKKVERTVKNEIRHLPVPNKKNISNPEKVQRYLYIVNLKNGGTLRATTIKKTGNIYSLKNERGLVMEITTEQIENFKKIKL